MKNVFDKRQQGFKVTANSLYGQCGAKTSDFYDKDVYQPDFFTPNFRQPKSEELMQTIDRINASRDSRITFAAQGIKKPWSMQRRLQSPRYTTNWNDLLIVR